MSIRTRICAVAAAALTVGATVLSAPAAGATQPAGSISGAGSTLVAPLLAEWIQEFQVFYGIQVGYNPVGSQGALSELSSGSVDFAATDSPLTSAEAGSCAGCLQVPWALTALAVGYHVSGLGPQLHLTGRVLAGIYRGKITRWNDSQIAALNPHVQLPSTRITPIWTNASGDTYVFTEFLSRLDSTWRKQVGTGDTVSFPTGQQATGNAGATTLLQSINGAIAYVGAPYLITHGLPAAAIRNAAGKFAYPNLGNITTAAKTIKSVPSNHAISIVYPSRKARGAYPLAILAYAVVRPTTSVPLRTALRDWLLYAVGPGSSFGIGLDYAPIPRVVASADKTAIKQFL